MKMGFLMNLPKTDNSLFADFENAYWSIEDLGVGIPEEIIQNADMVLRGELRAYATRDSKYHGGQTIQTGLPFGGDGMYYNPVLYRFYFQFNVVDVFPEGVPVSYGEMKAKVYPFLLKYLGLADNVINIITDEPPLES